MLTILQPLQRNQRPKIDVEVNAIDVTIDGIASVAVGLTVLTLLTFDFCPSF
jgi:hypothetical protein